MSPFPVRVVPHARRRAAERFGALDAARIDDEVRDALGAGRVSPTPPPGVRAHKATLYAWTEGGCRVYALRARLSCFAVVTTLRAAA